jgi:hypothetical protein
MSKEFRKLLSEQYFSCYYDAFDELKQNIQKELQSINERINLYKDRQYIYESNQELADNLQQISQLVIDMWTTYFVTEYHNTDKVTKILQQATSPYNTQQLADNVEEL